MMARNYFCYFYTEISLIMHIEIKNEKMRFEHSLSLIYTETNIKIYMIVYVKRKIYMIVKMLVVSGMLKTLCLTRYNKCRYICIESHFD